MKAFGGEWMDGIRSGLRSRLIKWMMDGRKEEGVDEWMDRGVNESMDEWMDG